MYVDACVLCGTEYFEFNAKSYLPRARDESNSPAFCAICAILTNIIITIRGLNKMFGSNRIAFRLIVMLCILVIPYTIAYYRYYYFSSLLFYAKYKITSRHSAIIMASYPLPLFYPFIKDYTAFVFIIPYRRKIILIRAHEI